MATQEQYHQLISALQALAGVCDGASSQDGMGFNGTDTNFGRSVAEQSLTTDLSPKQQEIAVKIIQKYRGQLMRYGIMDVPTAAEYGDMFGDAPTPEKKREPEVSIYGEDGEIHVKFTRNIRNNADRVKSLTWTDRRFDGQRREWIVQPRQAGFLLGLFPDADVDPRVRAYAESLGTKEESTEAGEDDSPISGHSYDDGGQGAYSNTGLEPCDLPDETEAPKMTVRLVKSTVIMKTPFFDAKWLEDCKAVPDRKFKETKTDGKHWRAPVSAVPWIVENWTDRDDIDLGPELIEAHANLQSRASMSRAADGELVDALPIPSGLSPYGYQKAGYNFMKTAGFRTLLADDMGLGKTIQAILCIMALRDQGPVLVSCPATVKLNWKRELEKWIPEISVRVIEGRTPKEAIDTGEHDVFIVNHDILATRKSFDKSEELPKGIVKKTKKKNLVFNGWIEQFMAVTWSLVVFDEGHKVGNTKTAIRGQAAEMICKESKRVIFLTGTPLPNRPKELWPILNMIDPVAWPDFFSYAQRYCGAFHNGHGWDFNESSNLDELHERIKPWVLRRMKTDEAIGLDLPEKTRVDIVLDMPKRTRSKYDKAVRDFADKARRNNGYVDPAERLTHLGNLKQLAAEAKLKQGIEWIKDFTESGNKLIVFAWHKATINAVMDALAKEKIGAVKLTGETTMRNRQVAVDSFQDDPDVQVFVGNIQAAGEGITLTAAADVVFLEYGWKPGEHAQAEDRAYRIGQENHVTAWYLNAKDTIDGLLFDIIDTKRQVVDMVLEGETADHDSDVMVMTEDKREWTDMDFVEAMTSSIFK